MLAGCALASASWAQQPGNHEALTKDDIAKVTKPEFSPYVGRNFPTNVLWGDTHLHTAVSVDAGTMNRIGQEDAFRFARGEEITTTHGLRVKLSRPLDFLVISDHAEMYGLMPQLLSGDPVILATEIGRKWYEQLTSGDSDLVFATAMEIVASLSKKDAPIDNDKAVRNSWNTYTALADRYNEPGRFSATPPWAATISTAMCSSVAMPPKPTDWCRFLNSTARTLKISGSSWTCSRKIPAPRYWRFPITAT
jgi:hypothetical protein